MTKALTVLAKPLQGAQELLPDHKYLTELGRAWPCPSNGSVDRFQDIDLTRNLVINIPTDLHEVAERAYGGRNGGAGRKRKWPFPDANVGDRISVRIFAPVNSFHGDLNEEYFRIRNNGLNALNAQKNAGTVPSTYRVATKIEWIYNKPEGMVLPHVAFYRTR